MFRRNLMVTFCALGPALLMSAASGETTDLPIAASTPHVNYDLGKLTLESPSTHGYDSGHKSGFLMWLGYDLPSASFSPYTSKPGFDLGFAVTDTNATAEMREYLEFQLFNVEDETGDDASGQSVSVFVQELGFEYLFRFQKFYAGPVAAIGTGTVVSSALVISTPYNLLIGAVGGYNITDKLFAEAKFQESVSDAGFSGMSLNLGWRF